VYQTQPPQPNPGVIIADDGQDDWANITTGYSATDPTIKGGTKGLNTDTAIVNVGCQYFSIGLHPSSVSPGAITVIIGTLMSCVSTAQKAEITFNLEGPLQPNACSSTESLMFTSPRFTLRPRTLQTVRYPFWLLGRICAGTYNVVATAKSASGVLLGTSSASLTVEKHHSE
jgi:hypothetical protein